MARLLTEAGQLEPAGDKGAPLEITPSGGYDMAIEAERAKRYERWLTELGYQAELRP